MTTMNCEWDDDVKIDDDDDDELRFYDSILVENVSFQWMSAYEHIEVRADSNLAGGSLISACVSHAWRFIHDWQFRVSYLLEESI